MRRLSLSRSSDLKGDEVRMLKSEEKIGWPVNQHWKRTLERQETERSLPVKGNNAVCSKIRVWM